MTRPIGTGYSPTPAEVRELRGAMTQEAFGQLIHKRARIISSYESGASRMSPEAWELVNIKREG